MNDNDMEKKDEPITHNEESTASSGEPVPSSEAEAPMADRGEIGYNKNPGYAELVYGTIMSPVSTFRRISTEPPLFKSFIIYIVVVILAALTGAIIPESSVVPSELSEVTIQAGPYLSVIAVLGNLVLWFLQGGVYQIFGELLGGTGKGLTTLTVLALAEIPRALLIPFQVLNYFLGESGISSFIYTVLTIGFMIWSGFILIIGLRETQKISTFRSVISVLAPIIIAILLIILLLAGLIVFLYPMIGSLNGG